MATLIDSDVDRGALLLVLVHGDIHAGNTLRAGGGWKLVDPDGRRAEREYDLGVMIRDADAGKWAPYLAARAGTDATAIVQWAAAGRITPRAG